MKNHNNKILKLTALDYRVPKWDIGKLRARVCPICYNANSIPKYIRPDTLTIRFCSICSTYFISPAPSKQQLSLFYSNYDKSHRNINPFNQENIFDKYKSFNPQEDYRIRTLSKYITLKNSKVLDIGFGRALFLYSLMRIGAIPYGIELDKNAVEYAKALGINNVYLGDLKDISENFKYNLIIFNDLIEHPLNPMSLIKKASCLLNNKGLLMIWTPNGDITDNKNNPITFRVNLDHMQYLTPNSCRYIAKKLKLNIIHLETLGYPNLRHINKSLINKIFVSKIKIKKAIIKILRKSFLYYVIIKLKKKSISKRKKEKRKGSYHLFCIMQKSL